MQRTVRILGMLTVILSVLGCATIRRVYTHDKIKDAKEKEARLRKDTIICRNKATQAKLAAVNAYKPTGTNVYLGGSSGNNSGYNNYNSGNSGYYGSAEAETAAFEACMTEADWTWEDIREEAK